MNIFTEIPASKQSLSGRNLVCGVGINDSNYVTSSIVNNKRITCPYYKTWQNMLIRCYDLARQKVQPTYTECTVCEEWLTFSNFRKWMETQDWQGKQLDKDILVQGNKLYSPNNCLFVSQHINLLLSTRRGMYKLGVYWSKQSKKYHAKYKNHSKQVHLGYFNTEQEAHEVYCKAKSNYIKEIAKEQTDLRLKVALITHASALQCGLI